MQRKNPFYKMLMLALPILAIGSTATASSPLPTFESPEHILLGNSVKIIIPPGNQSTGYRFQLPNNLVLTYGEILSMADFYGVIGQPISQGEDESARKTRFTAVFNTFATNPDATTELPKILAVIQDNQKAIDTGIKNGEKPEDIYAKIAGDSNRQWNCITGGGCSGLWWMQEGRYLKLSSQDFDHFGENAWLAYQAGHAVAMEQALKAHETHNIKQLELAYEMNALACHFLSDRFASGHLRTPRTELPASVTPSVVGSLLSNFMHNEENQAGLHVHNLRGDRWVTYGDRYYLYAINNDSRRILQNALQESANQIFIAYQLGTTPTIDLVTQMIPVADETNDSGLRDIAPLFYWDAHTKTLLRRTDTANPFDRHWTSNWWGWSTLAQLAKQKGLPIHSQGKLVSAGYGEKAASYGLITDKKLLNQITKMKQHSQ